MSENPYESPQALNDVKPDIEPPRQSSSGCIGAVVLIVLSIPAALIGCVTVCSITLNVPGAIGMRPSVTWSTISLCVGGICGVLAFGAFILAATMVAKGK